MFLFRINKLKPGTFLLVRPVAQCQQERTEGGVNDLVPLPFRQLQIKSYVEGKKKKLGNFPVQIICSQQTHWHFKYFFESYF